MRTQCDGRQETENCIIQMRLSLNAILGIGFVVVVVGFNLEFSHYAPRP